MKPVFYKIPAVAYALLIFTLSSFSLENVPDINIINFDKLIHCLEYGIFGILLMLAFCSGQSLKTYKKAVIFSLITGILYGASDEIHQSFVFGRNASLIDWSADIIGICLGVYFFPKLKFLYKKLL